MTSQIRILHVLTLNSGAGQYGGPVKVAQEICSELSTRGFFVEMLSGSIKGYEPTPRDEFKVDFEYVRSWSKNFPVSSLWSNKLMLSLINKIRSTDLIHIHIARELVPIAAAFICIFLRKPFLTQSHGMLNRDDRFLARLIDKLFLSYIFRKAELNFVLTTTEQDNFKNFNFPIRIEILPNGISYPLEYSSQAPQEVYTVVFCSRLQTRKRPFLFIELAEYFESLKLPVKFEIYGPDGGQKEFIRQHLNENRPTNLRMFDALDQKQVISLLHKTDLLVLPSRDEPFPMVILEALSIGAPVLIMPSCHIAEIVRKVNYKFVCDSEDLSGLIKATLDLYTHDFLRSERHSIRDKSQEFFGISPIVDRLEKYYREALAT